MVTWRTPAALLVGGQPESDQQVCLSCAAVAEQHHRLAVVQVGAGCEPGELARGDGGNGVGAEVRGPFQAREAGFGDAAGAAAAGAVVQLGGQDLGEIGQVGAAFPGSDLGQPGGLVADGGQLQLAGRGADGGPARPGRTCADAMAWTSRLAVVLEPGGA